MQGIGIRASQVRGLRAVLLPRVHHSLHAFRLVMSNLQKHGAKLHATFHQTGEVYLQQYRGYGMHGQGLWEERDKDDCRTAYPSLEQGVPATQDPLPQRMRCRHPSLWSHITLQAMQQDREGASRTGVYTEFHINGPRDGPTSFDFLSELQSNHSCSWS